MEGHMHGRNRVGWGWGREGGREGSKISTVPTRLNYVQETRETLVNSPMKYEYIYDHLTVHNSRSYPCDFNIKNTYQPRIERRKKPQEGYIKY